MEQKPIRTIWFIATLDGSHQHYDSDKYVMTTQENSIDFELKRPYMEEIDPLGREGKWAIAEIVQYPKTSIANIETKYVFKVGD